MFSKTDNLFKNTRIFAHLLYSKNIPVRFAKYATQPDDLKNSPKTPKLGHMRPLVDGKEICIENGLPVINIELPSRKETCQFILRPMGDSVGSLSEALLNEDSGIEIVSFYTSDGTRISKSTRIQHLLRLPSFCIRINDIYYRFNLQSFAFEDRDKLTTLEEIKSQIFSLYGFLNLDEYKLKRENSLMESIENVERELRPFIIIKSTIERECEEYTQRVFWVGFSAVCFQVGVFARLTWWEYSWDIMEPITYFSTFSSVLIALSYYIVTQQNFEYTSAHSRVLYNDYYRRALKYGFDVKRYNELHKLKSELTTELKRLQNPLLAVFDGQIGLSGDKLSKCNVFASNEHSFSVQ
uniref:Calcium uniporter protein n=1 Tax=Globodera rostochiensis TaxID=31243 RepID=A0A914HGX7_GLORO